MCVFYKLRYYVPLCTLRVLYFSLVQFYLQYSLINWGRAHKSTINTLEKLQNKIIRISLFGHKRAAIENLFSKFYVLKISDLYKLECAKFMYKFENGLLPIAFNNYFTYINSIHSYNTQYKKTNFFFQGLVQTMVKELFNILVYKYGLKFPKQLNIYLTYYSKRNSKIYY